MLRSHLGLSILVSFLGLASVGCSTTGGGVAPVEDRLPQSKPAALARPSVPIKLTAPQPINSPDTPHVYALPDAAVPDSQPMPTTPSASNPDLPPPTIAEPLVAPSDPAIRELLARSAQADAAGDRATARAIIERALKIKPEDPRVWYQLAQLNYASGDFEQAIVTAQRARTLASREPTLRPQIEQLIDAAQRALKRN